MLNNKSNGERIANNTIALYFRMILTLAVGLCTSRVILDSLGIEDYGIYNLVGGFIAMFNIFRAGLVSATQRFITYDLGKGNVKEIQRTFSNCVIIFLMVSAAIVVIAEIFGVWFIENKLTIPAERMYAAHWAFQFSLFTLVLNIISFPYTSLIIAHERMKAFAYISIVEVVAKLLVAFAIYVSPFDKLIVYAFLLCFVQFAIRMIYNTYCIRNFPESKIEWKIDSETIKKIYSFTGWELFGSVSVLAYTQGLNILLGMFFTPAINAARGVAVQVQGGITGFVTNFQTALNPQITKNYAIGNKEYMFKLVFIGSRASYYLLFLFALPLMLEADIILDLWLIEVPEYSVIFFRLIIITTMIDAISNPIITSVEATGNIRLYQVVVGGILLMILPVSYISLKLGAAPYSVFIVHVIFAFLAFFARLLMARRAIGLPVYEFITSVILRILCVTLLSAIIPFALHLFMKEGLGRLLIIVFLSVFLSLVVIYSIGLQSEERTFIKEKLVSQLPKFFKRL